MKVADISLWVASISDAEDDSAHDIQSRRKRPRALSRTEGATNLTHLPSPPADQCIYRDDETTMPNSPKRRRVINSGDDWNVTPRPRQKASAFDGAVESNLPAALSSSQPSKSDSSISRGSSPSKQLSNAELQPTGFYTAGFTDHDLPRSLQLLADDLERIQSRHGILPNSLRAELAGVKGIFPSNFGDDDSGASAFRYPPFEHIRLILEHAKKCYQHRHGESSWNMEVHARLLEWVLRTAPGGNGPLDYRYCVHAGILTEYKPKNAPSKLVDFCLPMEISNEEKSIIDNLRLIRPGLSINHTDWGDLEHNPIAISIETKAESGYRNALVQLGTWHAAQWRSLFYGGSDPGAIEFLPGIIVVGHQWFFVATVPGKDGGKPTILEGLSIGSTTSVLEIYMVIASLQRLKEWAETVFWPAFKEGIMDL